MKLARRGIDAGFALALAMVAAGCSDASNGHEDASLGEAASPLGFAPTPPPPVKRNLRLASPLNGCRLVATPTGRWTGTPIATPDGPSRSFCTYTWSSSTGASADVEALSPIAMKDGGVRPYVVNEVRTSNGAPPQVALPGQNKILAPGGAGGGGGGTGFVFGGGGLTTQGGSGQQAGGTFGLVAATDVNPEGFPGCEICGEVGEDWMFFVLPASALYAESVTLWTDEVPYDLGPVSTPVFYTPIPATYTNNFHLSW